VIAGVGVACAAVAALGWIAASVWAPGSVWLAVASAGAIFAAFAISLLVVAPWRAKPMDRWPAIWLAGRGVCFALTVVAALGLLYSAPAEGRPVTGLVIAGGYLAALVVESALVARSFRRATQGRDAPES